MPVKTDKNDARSIAQVMRVGWFSIVHIKSAGSQVRFRALGVSSEGQPERVVRTTAIRQEVTHHVAEDDLRTYCCF
jgi:hypothetical protein